MDCPNCSTELKYVDFYGFYKGNDNWDKKGDIFKCTNEECDCFDEYFHTDVDGDLNEGYPC